MDRTDENRSGQGEKDPGVIEASWAPKDPRDRLYDKDATAGERTMSLVRIIAAFHPVLNAFLLTGDMMRRIPPRLWGGMLALGAIALVVFLVVD